MNKTPLYSFEPRYIQHCTSGGIFKCIIGKDEGSGQFQSNQQYKHYFHCVESYISLEQRKFTQGNDFSLLNPLVINSECSAYK